MIQPDPEKCLVYGVSVKNLHEYVSGSLLVPTRTVEVLRPQVLWPLRADERRVRASITGCLLAHLCSCVDHEIFAIKVIFEDFWPDWMCSGFFWEVDLHLLYRSQSLLNGGQVPDIPG